MSEILAYGIDGNRLEAEIVNGEISIRVNFDNGNYHDNTSAALAELLAFIDESLKKLDIPEHIPI